MKEKVFSILAACCALALFAATTTYAQLSGTEMRATIPFDFSVLGKVLPAGDYEIRRITDTPDVLLISGVNNREHAVFQTEPVTARKAPNHGEIFFHRYGDSYFLSELFDGGETTGRELPESRRERNLRREIASNGNKNGPETVALTVY